MLFSDTNISHTTMFTYLCRKMKIMNDNRIKEAIKEKGYSITSLAEKMKIKRESLSRMIVSPSYPTLLKIAEALNVPLWQLFTTKEENGIPLVCPHCGKPIKVELKG